MEKMPTKGLKKVPIAAWVAMVAGFIAVATMSVYYVIGVACGVIMGLMLSPTNVRKRLYWDDPKFREREEKEKKQEVEKHDETQVQEKPAAEAAAA